MSWYNKVAWSEGLFLRPQLFQQQERYLEHLGHQRAAALGPFYWGFSVFELQTEALATGRIVLSDIVGVFPDGTPFEAPANDALPAPLTILPDHVDQLVYLAIPARAPNSEETLLDDPGAEATSLARYSVFDAELRDANSRGQGPKTVQLSRLRLRLLPQREMTSSWMGLPIARPATLHSDGHVVLDPTMIPPVSSYGASPVLTEWAINLHRMCELRANALASRLSGNDGRSSEAAEVADFLLLQILNRYEPLLGHWLKVPQTSPEQLYMALRAMSGELSTYVRAGTRRPLPCSGYKHSDLYDSFRKLLLDVQSMMNDVLVRSAQSIRLASRANGVSIASVDPGALQEFSSLVLAVASQLPSEQLLAQFPARCKVGPSDRLAELIRSNLPGIPLAALPVPPRQIPFNAGFLYFQLEARGPLWDQLLKHGGLGLHVGTEFPGLSLELWGIREK